MRRRVGLASVSIVLALASFGGAEAQIPIDDQPVAEDRIIYISDTCVSPEYPGTDCDTDMYTVAADGSDPQRVTATPMQVEEFPAFSQDGTEIAFNSYDRIAGISGLWLMEADGSNARPITSPVSAWNESFSWSPTGGIAFTRWPFTAPGSPSGHSNVFLLSRVGEVWTEEPLLTTPGSEYGPDFSPDGRRIAYDYDADDDGIISDGEAETSDICVARADGTGHRCLTKTPYLNEGCPAWSPDGEWIAFSRGLTTAYWRKYGRASIWIMRPDGSGIRRLTTGYKDVDPAWSPDGERIAFSRCRSAGSDYDCGIAVIELAHPDRVEILVDAEGLLEAHPSWRPATD